MRRLVLLTLPAMLLAAYAIAGSAPGYQHDRWGTLPRDHIFEFAAYTTSFDGVDDNDGDGDPDKWGIPEWVAFEIKGNVPDHPLPNRPSWTTDATLHSQGIAPNDDTYAVSGTTKMREVKDAYRFVRGHMCPKDTAERVSADAARETHTMLNAVPQLQWQNNGVWKAIEELCIEWADRYGRVWVVCGPVFFGKNPAVWLGQEGEVKAAVPDALYKVVIREDGDSVDTIAFLIPNIVPKEENDPKGFLTSVDRIEALTGLDFLTALPAADTAVEETEALQDVQW